MMSCIANRFKSLILIIVNVFKRALCIFQKRRRKPSGDAIITGVVIDNGLEGRPEKLVPWNSWDDEKNAKPATVEDHIEQYRKSLAKLRTTTEEAPQELDFFNDMTPEIKTSNVLKLNFHPQPSLVQKVTFEVQENFSPSIMASSELGEIVDEEEVMATAGGWDTDESDLSEVLKQQRLEERRKRSEGFNQKRAHKDRFNY